MGLDHFYLQEHIGKVAFGSGDRQRTTAWLKTLYRSFETCLTLLEKVKRADHLAVLVYCDSGSSSHLEDSTSTPNIGESRGFHT